MSIPASVTTALTSLQKQVTAATPLESASRATLSALQLNAQTLVASIDTALANAAGQLDTYVAATDPIAIISGVQALLVSADDQWNLAVMRGLVGRAASNLDQLGPIPTVPKIVTPLAPLPPPPVLPPPETGQGRWGTFNPIRTNQFRFN